MKVKVFRLVLTTRSRGGDVKSEAGECSATFILFTEVGSTSVDFSHICTLLEYLFS